MKHVLVNYTADIRRYAVSGKRDRSCKCRLWAALGECEDNTDMTRLCPSECAIRQRECSQQAASSITVYRLDQTRTASVP